MAAFVITLAVALHFFYKKNIDTYQNRLFSILIWLELVSSALDLITIYTIGHPDMVSRAWHYLLNGGYLLSFNATSVEDEKAMYALKYTMAMVKAMGMELVAGGVENEDHIRLLTELGCDFFQGYYYSKPVSGELFLEKIGA